MASKKSDTIQSTKDNIPPLKNVNNLSMVEQYEYYLDYYTKIYPKCTVILQNGGFYEIYAREGKEDTPLNKNIRYMEKTLYLNVSCTYGRLMAGFPTNAKSKWLEILLGLGWTVVQVDQDKQETGTDRHLAIIHSPGTYLPDIDTEDNKFIVCIRIEAFKNPEFDPVTVGITAIDVTTGETHIYEVYNNKEDQFYAVDEITRFLQSFRPKEILFYSEEEDLGQAQIFKNNFRWKKSFDNIKYSTSVIEKIYGKSLHILCIERFTSALASTCALLEYCQDHNPQLIKNLGRPRIFCNSKYLQLANNAVSQLDIVNNDKTKFGNIFNLVNFTSTPMGHRLLQQRLLFPLKDVEEINKRYQLVECFTDYGKYEKLLVKISDIEKIIRKLHTFPTGLINLTTSLSHAVDLVTLLTETEEDKKSRQDIHALYEYMTETVDMENKERILKGVERLNILYRKIDKCKSIFNDTYTTLNRMVDKVDMILDEKMCCFKTTHKKIATIKQKISNIEPISQNKTYVYFTTTDISTSFDKYIKYLQDANTVWQEEYKKYVDGLLSVWGTKILKICTYIASIDVAVSTAKCAHKYRYVRPVIKDGIDGGKNNKSFIKMREIRHPIIERISSSIYVPHNLDLGYKEESPTGVLLYGFNASGKSSLMKTIGCNLIMAQAGLYVAAAEFKYFPFDNILTRIIGTDNIQKGLSSFAVEMSELNGILSRATESSLILGDEISHGTESISAVSIVASAIETLLSQKCIFLFATHLHELAKMTFLSNNTSKDTDDPTPRLSIYHLAVERKGKEIIYRRDLQDGPGDSLYGIEVARAMRLPDAFISRALAIRKDIVGEISKKTKYNSEMFLEKCGVCSKPADEVHHIRFQSEADKDGFIDHFHKNHLRNLVGLCTGCHKKLHRGHLSISGWVETSFGFYLEYKD
uniref:DNA mismatch repair proteins mutS family domain-containing protein n=1 Tax=viral metagenome TaxID=1070528 RepID=A0A6C0JWX0_9ZZZZ